VGGVGDGRAVVRVHKRETGRGCAVDILCFMVLVCCIDN
jgi:hypothetical protein